MNKNDWIDLHLHTLKSDGTLTPKEVIQLAVKNKIKIVSITDHDTIAGIEEAREAADHFEIKLIPGIEISSEYKGGTLHILGYGIDINNKQLLTNLAEFQDIRKNRNVKIVEKLNSLGFNILIDDMFKRFNGIKSLGRPHIAKMMLDKGYVISIDQAFNKYLGRGKIAFVRKETFTAEESIKIIHDANGLAVLAHPITLNLSGDAFDRFLKKLIGFGLDGMEVYASLHNTNQVDMYKNIALGNDLFISAGSDFHGDIKPDIQVGYCQNNQRVTVDMITSGISNPIFS